MLPAMTVTMADIAKSLNVSVVTVSKALRDKGKISAATRKRVLQRAKQMNYQTNWIARSLVTRRTFTVGLLLPDFTHPFFAEVAKAVAEAVRPQGYHVVISYFEEDAALERQEAESLVARQVDGLIVASAQPAEGTNLFAKIRKRGIPFVLIDRYVPGVQAGFVGVDNEALGHMATTHLIEQGCRKIAHLRGPVVGIANARLKGYRDALEKHRIACPPEYVVEARYEDSSGYHAMQKLLRAKSMPDGTFCYNDPVAIGAMKAILEAGLRVPNDIAVIGAGNVRYSDLLTVPLTTIDQSTKEIGKQSAEMLMEQISSKASRPPHAVLIPPKLVVRQSTMRTADKTV